jgi:hypothetical protein
LVYPDEVERGWRFFAGPKHTYTGHEKIIPVGDFVYLGDDDPYCYVHLVYDTWWFQDKTPKKHCLDEMRKDGCTLIQHEVQKSSLEFLEFKNQEVCVGLKDTKLHINRGVAKGWFKVFTVEPKIKTPLGVLFFVKIGTEFVQVHGSYRTTSLVLVLGEFYNHKLTHEQSAPWVKPKWIMGVRAKSFKGLIEGVIAHRTTNENGHLYPWEDGECNTMLTNQTQGFKFLGEEVRPGWSSSKDTGITCARGSCRCASLPYRYLVEIEHEKLLEVNYEWTWYGSLLNWLTGIANKLLNTITGGNWQTTLALMLVEFYLGTALFRNQWVGLGTAVLTTYWLLKD